MTKKTRVYVHLDHGRSPANWNLKYETKRVWEPFPYGYQYASGLYDMSFSEDRGETGAQRFFRRGLSWFLGFDILHAWTNRTQINEAEVIWTHTEHEHLAVSTILKISKNDRTKLIAQSVWLWDKWQSYSRARRALYKSLLKRASVHTTHSSLNREIAEKILHPNRVLLVPYGTEQIDRVPRRSREDDRPLRVVAPGNDRDRDWSTLVQAVKGCEDMELRIVSKRSLDHITKNIPNVSVVKPSGIKDLWANYLWADVVAISLTPNHHASGLTVALEALNAGLPVAATRVGGLEEYFGNGILKWAKPRDANSLGAAIRAAGSADRGDDAARELVVKYGLTARDYSARHAILTDLLVSGTSVEDARVSSFATIDILGPQSRA